MITIKVWRCARCGTENTFGDPGIMIVMPGRDVCKNCKKIRTGEPIYRVRIKDD